MTTMLFAAIAFSIAMIALLWRGDPKRRRVAGLADKGHGPGLRRAIVFVALLPGVLLAVLGDSAAFLVWLGSCVMAGWLITQLRPARR